MTDYDFKLDGEFGDAQKLRASLMKSAIPVHIAEFLSKVHNINKISFMYHDDNDQVEESPICLDNDDHPMQRQTTPVLGWRSRVMSLFKVLLYSVQMVNTKTPMHLTTAHCIMKNVKAGNLSRVRTEWVCASVTRKYWKEDATAQFISETSSTVLSLPSHFVRESFTIGAMDNVDHNEATMSGLNICHDTVMVLFQEVTKILPNKIKVAETTISRRTKRQALQLPCQTLQKYHRLPPPLVLPTTFKYVTDLYQHSRITDVKQKNNVIIDIIHAINAVNEQPEPAGTWGALNAVTSDAHVPLKHVGFLPILPFPVTDYNSLYPSMKNFNGVLSKLVQVSLPVACDEDAYNIAKEIQMTSNEFNNIILMMGSFHMTKVLLTCVDKYICGSGLENIFIENSVFGTCVTQATIQGSDYVRSTRPFYDVICYTTFEDERLPYRWDS